MVDSRDIINSGMINEKYFNEDWDKDGLTNLNEIMQETNPLNELETDPRNWSERYAILLETPGHALAARTCISLYHLLKKNGYDDDHITIFFTLLDMHKKAFYENEWGDSLRKWLKGDPLKDYPVMLDYPTRKDVTIENYVKTLTSLPSDENDIVLIWYEGHGGFTFYSPEYSKFHINKQMPYITSMQYGRLIFINDSCSAENEFKYIEDYLLKRYNIKEFLGIASSSVGESVGDTFTLNFFPALERGLSIREAFEYTKKVLSKEHFRENGRRWGQHPVIYYFNNSEKKECLWLYFNFLKYIRRK